MKLDGPWILIAKSWTDRGKHHTDNSVVGFGVFASHLRSNALGQAQTAVLNYYGI
jgi:hypothetical protein